MERNTGVAMRVRASTAFIALLSISPLLCVAEPTFLSYSYTIDKADCCTDYSVGVNVDVTGDAPITSVTVSHVPLSSGSVGTWALSQLGPTWWWNWSPARPLFSTGPLDGSFVITAVDSNGASATMSDLAIPAGSELDFPTVTISAGSNGYALEVAPVANADYYNLWVVDDVEGYVYWQTVTNPADLVPIPYSELTTGRRYWVYWMAVNVIPTGTQDSVFRSYAIRQIVHMSIDALLQKLAGDVVAVGPGKSLTDKVAIIRAYYAVPDVVSTCSALTDFRNEVAALGGKKISATVVANLLNDADAIMSALGCPQAN